MSTAPVFTSRLAGRQLLDSEGLSIGRVRDVIILPSASGEPPWVLGLIVTLQRRQIFVNLGRIAEISVDGVQLRGGTIDLRRFSRRTGELLASEVYGQTAGTGSVLDVGIAPSQSRRGGWEVTALAIGQARGLGLWHSSSTIVPWDKYPELFKAGPLAEQLIQLREMHPTDLANAVEVMSAARRRELAEALQDEELADLLEEMPEQDQIRLLSGLGLERTADIVEEMEPDDAADLLAEMPPEQRERLLAAMETVQAADLRRLLRYDATTAGGLMTSASADRAARRSGRPGTGPDPRARDRRDGRRAGLRLRAAVGDPDRPLSRHGRIPAAAAPAASDPGRRVRRGKRASYGPSYLRRKSPGAWPPTT